MAKIVYKGSDGCRLYATIVGQKLVDARDSAVIVLMHGGGPDHYSLMPLGKRLSDQYTVVLPDIRGYGRSVCRDPLRHTWRQYADDVVSLLFRLGINRAVIGGAGIGTTIALRTALAYPERVRALTLISVEDIEDDEAKQAEIEFMNAFAKRVRTKGIEAAWAPILDDLAPIIGTMVRDAIPRSDPASIAAAAHIGGDRSFRSVNELAGIKVPTLIIPGMDARHPVMLAETLARMLPRGRLAAVTLSDDVRTTDDFAQAFAPVLREFLATELA